MSIFNRHEGKNNSDSALLMKDQMCFTAMWLDLSGLEFLLLSDKWRPLPLYQEHLNTIRHCG